MPRRERQALREARESGDADRLYAALKAEADRQEAKARQATLTYLKIGTEIVALESLRSGTEHA